MKYIGITDHARLRVKQRTVLSTDDVMSLLYSSSYVNLGSKPGIQKAHLWICINIENSWFVVVRDVLNGDVITFLTEDYHVNLFGKISDVDKKEAYEKATRHSSQSNGGESKNINISLSFVDCYGAVKTKKIKSFPYDGKNISKDAFLLSKDFKTLVKQVKSGVESGEVGDVFIGTNYEPVYLKVAYSKSDYVIIDI